jgi:hypothetical protein
LLPAFTVGRPRWDSWFVYHARRLNIPVIDASRVVTAIHQNHDYSHIPKKDSDLSEGSEAQWEGPETRQNRKLSTESIGSGHQFSLLDASHILTPTKLLPAVSMRYARKRWHSLPVLYPKTKPFVQVVNRIISAFKQLKALPIRNK